MFFLRLFINIIMLYNIIMTKIRLAKNKAKSSCSSFNMVVIDSKKPRDSGSFLAIVGQYTPKLKTENTGEKVKINLELLERYISHGAQPTDKVKSLIAAFKKFHNK